MTEIIIASEVQPSVDLDVSSDQSPLLLETKATQQSKSDGIQSQEERILIDEGAFIEESSSNNDLQNYQLARDRAHREIHAPTRYGYADLVAYALTCATDSIKADPLTFEDAIVSDSQKKWKDPTEAELFSLQKNQTWSLMDVTTTFLYRDLEGVMYMAQPKGYEVKGKEDMDFTRTHMMLVFTENYLRKESYEIKLLEKYNMSGCKAVSTPIVSHFRLSSSRCPVTEQERLDLGYAISMISRFMSNFGKEHWKAVKWVLRYLKGSASVSLCYSKDCDKSTLLEGFTNVDDAANLDKRRSLVAHIFRLYEVKEAVWLERIVGEFLSQEFILIIHCDS
ncbi:Retrovirus-related Pol polyprotein from transposon TNT 1-94 [Cucumis melo var. makuwa]|uniref:Retrovirus-related Pol polyprotein from transposon TNT 1-94 n=1 Tax=Cucumis melo var. makuwa TaxID=1194695 RepID=A0A5A7VH96_CUCMM|nr:Retrovirus-related Pol polyprotein from transposon TNT 1-94 [Cucumis melo var. makuwa]